MQSLISGTFSPRSQREKSGWNAKSHYSIITAFTITVSPFAHFFSPFPVIIFLGFIVMIRLVVVVSAIKAPSRTLDNSFLSMNPMLLYLQLAAVALTASSASVLSYATNINVPSNAGMALWGKHLITGNCRYLLPRWLHLLRGLVCVPYSLRWMALSWCCEYMLK